MFIVSDTGTDIINTEQAFSFNIGVLQDGTDVLVVYGPGVNCPIAAVGDRPQRALAAIVKAHKERWLFLDLGDLLGPRPNLTVAKPKIVIAGNGHGNP